MLQLVEAMDMLWIVVPMVIALPLFLLVLFFSIAATSLRPGVKRSPVARPLVVRADPSRTARLP